ncbi:MAG: anti-sigma factor antagonist [Bacilli bacterium]|nr:anti-sigma factor antagonist [Bacilli bacterium]
MKLNVQMSVRGSTLIMRLKGDLDQSSIDSLKRKSIDIIDKYYIKNIVFNLEQVQFMDSSGIGFIIGRFAQIKHRRGRVIICSMNSLIERIFNLSGLKRICSVVDNEEQATRLLEVA